MSVCHGALSSFEAFSRLEQPPKQISLTGNRSLRDSMSRFAAAIRTRTWIATRQLRLSITSIIGRDSESTPYLSSSKNSLTPNWSN